MKARSTLLCAVLPLCAGLHASSPSTQEKTNPEKKGICSQKEVFTPNQVVDSHRVWVDAEVLFWQPNMGSLSYGVTSSSTSGIQNGHTKRPDFDWDAGVRVGLGYKIPHDNWDVLLQYTYFQGNAAGHAGHSGTVVYPSWANAWNFAGPGLFYVNKARAHWRLNLNMGDIELGRVCKPSSWLSLRPFLGVRGAVIDQDYHVKYSGGSAFPGDTDSVHLDSDFWGVGLRGGLDTLWGLGCGIGIYGNGSVSLLSGHFDVHETEHLNKARITRLNIKSHPSQVVAVADLALGLQWDYLFNNDRNHFGVKLGWEFNIFFNQNQLFNFRGTGTPGSLHFQKDDLTFQGVTLGFRLDF